MNGGTSLGIAGENFAVIAADTRLSEGYSIMTRDISRSTVLTSKCVIATGGCHTDVHTLHKVLSTRVATYRHDHDADMSCTALAQMLGNTLYYRRFFPYYAFNVSVVRVHVRRVRRGTVIGSARRPASTNMCALASRCVPMPFRSSAGGARAHNQRPTTLAP